MQLNEYDFTLAFQFNIANMIINLKKSTLKKYIIMGIKGQNYKKNAFILFVSSL